MQYSYTHFVISSNRMSSLRTQYSINFQGTQPYCLQPINVQGTQPYCLQPINVQPETVLGTLPHCATKKLMTEMLDYSQLHSVFDVNPNPFGEITFEYLCFLYDEVSKFTEMQVMPLKCTLDLPKKIGENKAYVGATISPMILHYLPRWKILLDPAVRTKHITLNWIWNFEVKPSLGCRTFLELSSTSLDFKDLRHHMKNFLVAGEGPFNPGKVLRLGTVRKLSQKKYYEIGEEIMLKYVDSCWDESDVVYAVIVLDYEEGDTEDDDDIDSVILKVRVRIMWLCNRKVESIAATKLRELYQVYRTENDENRELKTVSLSENEVKKKDNIGEFKQEEVETVERMQRVEEIDNIGETQQKRACRDSAAKDAFLYNF